MNTLKLLRALSRQCVSDITSPRWLVIFFIALNLAMFSDLIVLFYEKMNMLTSDEQLTVFRILTGFILILTVCEMFFADVSDQKTSFSSRLIIMACGVLAFMSMTFISVMISEYMLELASGLLGTKCDRVKTLSSIGYGMGGILAVIGATAIHRRANAEAEDNRLTEKGHDNKRFQNMVNDLGHDKVTVRVVTFYRFYYMAKKKQKTQKKTNDFRKDVFEILCSYLRAISNVIPDLNKENEHQMERQALSNVLFKEKFKSKSESIMDDDFVADLQNIDFNNMDFSNANLSNADLSSADLSNVDFSDAKLRHANLRHAKLRRAKLSNTDMSDADLARANLARAYLVHTDLTNAKLVRANLARAIFYLADFSGARLTNANLSKTNLSHENLSGVSLSGANLSEVDLSDADLSNAKLMRANLSGANLQKTQLKGVNLMDIANIKHADFRGAKMGDRSITKGDLPADKGEYYADWNPPPEKEEN